MCRTLISILNGVAQIAKALNPRISKFTQIVLDTCAYAGTGNVLKIQELLALCGEKIETDVTSTWKVSVNRTYMMKTVL